MSAVAFDTLKFAQILRDKAKFTPEQAEGLSEAFAQASADQLASKADISGLRADLQSLRADLQSDVRQVELRLEAKIEAIKSDMVEWMFGSMGFQTIVILGAVLALSHFAH